jgi:hypothetical protein
LEATKRCPYCAEEILFAATKCKHCKSDLAIGNSTSNTSLDVPSNLVEDIGQSLEKHLASLLEPSETVYIRIKGAFKEALICTDRRVLILKTGFMTGHMFGTNVFQSAYRSVTSAQVNTHLLSGYFELSAGGVQNTATGYWMQGKKSARERDNCISLVRDLFAKFQRAAAFIIARCG